MRLIFGITLLFLSLGAGCVTEAPASTGVSADPARLVIPTVEPASAMYEPDVVVPIDPEGLVGYHPTYKRYGELVDDRFQGYHTGEDHEVVSETTVPVRAMADGRVAFVGEASGYGGVMILVHEIDGQTISSLYGHIDVDSTVLELDDEVVKGSFLANLGDGHSEETDGARQHLHFGLWEGEELQFAGYVKTADELDGWINPYDFFVAHGALSVDEDAWITASPFPSPQSERPETVFDDLSFSIPEHWNVQYVPDVDELTLYDASGGGSATERAQIVMRPIMDEDTVVRFEATLVNPFLDDALYEQVAASMTTTATRTE